MSLRYLCIGSTHFALQHSTFPTSPSVSLQDPHSVEMKPLTNTQQPASQSVRKPAVTILAEFPRATEESSNTAAIPAMSTLTPATLEESAIVPILPSVARIGTGSTMPGATMLKKIFDSLVFESMTNYEMATEAQKTSQFGLLPNYFPSVPSSPRARMIEDTRSNWNYFYLASSPSSQSSPLAYAIADNLSNAEKEVSDGRIIVGCVTTSDVRKRTVESLLERVLMSVSYVLQNTTISEANKEPSVPVTFRNENQVISSLQEVLREHFQTFGSAPSTNGVEHRKTGSTSHNVKASNFVQNVLQTLAASSPSSKHKKLSTVDVDAHNPEAERGGPTSHKGGNKYNAMLNASLDGDEDDAEVGNYKDGLVDLKHQPPRDLGVIYPRGNEMLNQTQSPTDVLSAGHSSSGISLRRRRVLIAIGTIILLAGAVGVIVYFMFFRRRIIHISYDKVVEPPLR